MNVAWRLQFALEVAGKMSPARLSSLDPNQLSATWGTEDSELTSLTFVYVVFIPQ